MALSVVQLCHSAQWFTLESSFKRLLHVLYMMVHYHTILFNSMVGVQVTNSP